MKALTARLSLMVLAVTAFASVATVYTAPVAHAAACVDPATDYGKVTSTVTIPSAGSYSVWSRLAAPSSGSNSYMLEIDGNTCFTVSGNSNGTYTSGATTHFKSGSENWTDLTGSTPITHNFTSAGTHTIEMIGTAADVYLDRVIFTMDTACTPTGTGNNCANPPDTTPPVVAINSVTPSTTTQGRVTVSSQATEPDGVVTKLELYVDNNGTGTPVATSNGPFTSAVDLVANGLSIGSHYAVVKATNASGVTSVTSQENFTIADVTAPSAASVQSPAGGSTQSGTITVSGTGTDNVGITKIEFYVDGNLFGTDTTPSTFTSTLDTTTLTNGSHALTAKVFDATGRSRTSSGVTITVSNNTGGTDTTPPTVAAPAGLAGGKQVLSGKAYQLNASISDASGIKSVEYRLRKGTTVSRSGTVTSAPFAYTLNTTTLTPGTYTLSMRATDQANNVSAYTADIIITITLSADVNRSCTVNFSDISAVVNRLGTANYQGAENVSWQAGGTDTNVNFSDISAIVSKIGQAPCTMP